MLQGTDTARFLASDRVEEVARLLTRARAQFPELADIGAGPDLTRLEVHVADSVRSRLRRDPRDAANARGLVPLRTTRVAALDSLNVQLGARQVLAAYIGERFYGFYVLFRPWPNIPVLRSAYDALPQVAFADVPLYVGDGSFIRLIPKGRQDHLVFVRGRGDCPAGCTEVDYYYITADRQTARLRKEKQLLHTDTLAWRAQQVHLWDFPTRQSFMPYPTVDSLLAGTISDFWWLRQHALDALLYLLGPNSRPWFGASEQDPERFREMQGELRRRQGDATEALVGALADSDPDLQVLVQQGLRRLYSLDFGVGAPAQRQWRTWLAQHPK